MVCYVYCLFLSLDFSSVAADDSIDLNLDDCRYTEKHCRENDYYTPIYLPAPVVQTRTKSTDDPTQNNDKVCPRVSDDGVVPQGIVNC